MIRDALAGFSDTVLTRIPKEILMKKLILASALSTLMAGAAFAQSAVVVYDDGVQKNARITDYDMTPATALATPEITYEGYAPIPDGDLAQLTADNLDDQTVYGVNNEAVGEIDELILTQGGQIDRVVLEVGGFLGLGEREGRDPVRPHAHPAPRRCAGRLPHLHRLDGRAPGSAAGIRGGLRLNASVRRASQTSGPATGGFFIGKMYWSASRFA